MATTTYDIQNWFKEDHGPQTCEARITFIILEFRNDQFRLAFRDSLSIQTEPSMKKFRTSKIRMT
jgi:hypothetical protein